MNRSETPVTRRDVRPILSFPRIIDVQLLLVAIALLKEGVPYDRSRLERKTNPKELKELKELDQWLVAEPMDLPATMEKEPVMVSGG